MLKSLVKKALSLADLELVRAGSHVPATRRAETAAELEALYRQFVLPGLPAKEGRERHLAALEGTNIGEALYVLDALHRGLAVEGHVCEFGVAQGATSALLASELRDTTRHLYLFDSFEGLPKPTAKDVLIDDIFHLGSMEAYQGKMSYGPAHVIARLRAQAFPFDRVHLVPGFIEKTLDKPGLPDRVAFAYVDFDFYEPIKVVLEYLERVMPVGGQAVVDDYGWFSAGAQAAVDEFVDARPGRWQRTLPIPAAGHFAVLARTGP